MERQKANIADITLKMKNNVEGISLPNFKNWYVTYIDCVLWVEGQTGQWNRAENPEIDLCKYPHTVFDKCAKRTHAGKTGFSTNGSEAFGHP